MSVSHGNALSNWINAGATLLTVIQALERVDGAVETAADIRWIVVGIEDSNDILTTEAVRSALQLLVQHSVWAVEQDEGGYRVPPGEHDGYGIQLALPRRRDRLCGWLGR